MLISVDCGFSPGQLLPTPVVSDATLAHAIQELPEEPRPAPTPELVLDRGSDELSQLRHNDPPSPAFSAPVPPQPILQTEPYHWKGLLLQSLAFQGLEHGPRMLAADPADRHLLLNKPFWSDYWASLGQYNMRRWNDGDSFIVNYAGHPMQGAISGYIEIQNDPRGRDLRISGDRQYWNSRFRAFLWETAYSTEFEIGPISEASIFNQGGYTYPLGCREHDLACEKTAKYTNNTGWVDFIVTPVGGTLMLIAEDAVDRYVTDPLVADHPHSFRYKFLRSSLNPNRSLANLLRGRYPWYREFEHPIVYPSAAETSHQDDLEQKPAGNIDLNPFYSSLSLPAVGAPCRGCRQWTNGIGAEVGVSVARHLDVVTSVRTQSSAGSIFPLTYGGSLLTAHFGLRSGYSGRHFAFRGSLSPGFASYSDTYSAPSATQPNPSSNRSFNFSALAAVSGDLRFTSHLAFRATVEQMVIRYKGPDRDPPGIGAPPRLSFLSHDNYINATNWGVRIGPVIRF